MALHAARLLLSLLFLMPAGLDSKGYCSFPQFVWSPLPDGSRRQWLTETTYISRPDLWDSQKEITTRETEMIVRRRQMWDCRSSGDEPCYRQETLYRLVCIAQEPDEKYRVQLKGDNSTQFTCMKFVNLAPSFIQIYIADPKPINEDRLCYDSALDRHPWPWIAPEPDKWHQCPFIGGFDFRIYRNGLEEMCHKIWRPSRLESECIYGEGMTFHFPDSECSPFIDQRLEQQVQCWGNWTEGGYQFVLLAEAGKHPQFVMRIPLQFGTVSSVDLPISGDANSEEPSGIHVDVFLNPAAPITKANLVKYDHLYHYQLRMTKSESGVCYDESERCKAFAKQGKCINRALHKYANFCKRSCGRCDIAPSTRQECVFPLGYQGEWVLFDGDAKETVTVTPGEIYFSHLGNFICKATHWERNHFKLLTVVNNGCRPRYACVHFAQETEHSLQFRISRSTRQDASLEEMCSFHNDALPLGDRIRSIEMKTMLAQAGLVWKSCGLGGELRVNASKPSDLSCFGTLFDWDTKTCTSLQQLSLTFNNCRERKQESFACEAFMSLSGDRSVLITKRLGDTQYSCWDISTRLDTVHMYPDSWTEAYQRRAAVCGSQRFQQIATSRDFRLHIRPYEDRVQQNCRKGQDSVMLDRPTRPTFLIRTTSPQPAFVAHTPKVSKVAQTSSVHEPSRARERKSNNSPPARTNSALQLCLLIVCRVLTLTNR